MSAPRTDSPGALPLPRQRRGRGVFIAVIIAVLLALACRLWVMEPVAVDSDSMQPTVRAGSLVFVFKPGPELFGVHSGDLVVFPSPADGTPVIKRVVAVGGQQIEVHDAVLYVDSSPVAEPFVDLATIDGTHYPRTEVPAGTVFVMGDNRERSIDSRDYGPVPMENIDGLVLGMRP
ncbi:signal peptidase I [Paeniglutamicibacter sp. NPDC012692]|uniref:signal peptidase I n=1 Tax=Paeniglutamicibacter sp. NPDC012692 TaxID=3364388 RepID=UPI00368B94C7